MQELSGDQLNASNSRTVEFVKKHIQTKKDIKKRLKLKMNTDLTPLSDQVLKPPSRNVKTNLTIDPNKYAK